MSDSEQDARIALLDHFSSKSTNEAIILLTEAFAFFTFVGLFYTSIYGAYFVVVASGLFVCSASYAFGRLICWGEHATAILCAKILNEDEVQKRIEKNKDKLGLSKPIKNDGEEFILDLLPTNLQSLSLACGIYLGAKYRKSRLVRLSYFLQSRKWMLSVFTFTVAAFIITLIIKYYFLTTT
jgi:hypothetical protein